MASGFMRAEWSGWKTTKFFTKSGTAINNTSIATLLSEILGRGAATITGEGVEFSTALMT